MHIHLPLALLAISGGDEPLTATAHIAEGELAAFTLNVELAEGVDAGGAGIPALILQLDVPQGVTLAGEVLDTLKKQQRNDFLFAPYERLVEPGETTIEFTAGEGLAEDATIGINLVGYLVNEERGAFFQRTRLELPVAEGAEATLGDADDSSWGPNDELLKIGDTFPALALPRADGTEVDLGTYRGDQNLVVTTYRAFW